MATITEMAKGYRTIQALIKQYEADAEKLRQAMISYLQEAGENEVKADVFTVKYAPYEVTRLDTAALRSDLPEITDRYMVKSEQWRFMVA